MSKSKHSKSESSRKDVEKQSMSKVKNGRVEKVVSKPKIDSSKAAKISKDAKKVQKKVARKADSDSDSNSESSDSEASASGSESDSSEASKSSSSSAASGESEKLSVPKKAAPQAAINGAASDGSESDDEDASDDEAVPPKASKALGVTAATARAAKEDESESGSSSESESNEKQAAAGQTSKAAKAQSDSGSASGSDDSSSSGSDDDEPAPAAKAAAPVPKRKAVEEEAPAAKKTKTDAAPASSNGVANLFVGNLSWNIDEEWLAREFAAFGEVISCRIITDRDSGRSKGFGYVEFSSPDDAARAHENMKGSELDGRNLNVDFANPRADAKSPHDKATSRASKFGDATSPPSDTLFVGNIPFGSDADSLRAFFEEVGAVAGVRLPTDRDTGEIKGFGYVSYASVDEAQAAHDALRGTEFNGRPLRLDFAGPRPEREDGGGRGGGRGGGGFRGRGGDRGGSRGGFRGDRGGGFRGGRGAPDGNWRGGRGGARGGGRGGSTNRGGIGDFSGSRVTF